MLAPVRTQQGLVQGAPGKVDMAQFRLALENGIASVPDAPPALAAFFAEVESEPPWLDRDLVEACRAAVRGEPFLYPGAVRSLMRDFVERARRGETPPDDPLTPRERQVLGHVIAGRLNKQIAARLGRPPPPHQPLAPRARDDVSRLHQHQQGE